VNYTAVTVYGTVDIPNKEAVGGLKDIYLARKE
jgi:hypothetical protein